MALTIDGVITGTAAFLILPKEIYEYNSLYIILTHLILITTLNWSYCCSMESSKYQATIGKRLLGVMVVDQDYERITFARASTRYWAKLLSGLVLGFGFFVAFSHEKRQALHDRMAGTYVVNKSFLLFMRSCQQAEHDSAVTAS
ncbi:RDD family protein [compost metagenome]